MESSSTNKRIGIFGGSFDPVHLGHLIIAQDATEQLNLSEVLFVPASIPPHKQHLEQVAVHHRLKMLQLAIESNDHFSVSDQEMERGGISYSIDTIKAFRGSYPNAELVFLVGSDTLLDLHNWYRIDELMDLCEVASFMRPSISSIEDLAKQIKVSERHKKKLLENVFQTHLIEISSTEIRRRKMNGQGIHYLVPPVVDAYIDEHGLYEG